MDTDLSRDCAAAVSPGHAPRGMYEAGLRGALCDARTRVKLSILAAFPWNAAEAEWRERAE